MTENCFTARGHLQSALRALALLLIIMNAASASGGVIERGHHPTRSFNVLAYNIYMRPAGLIAHDQADRGAVLPSKLRGFDVFVFSEAFDDTVRNQLLADLRGEYLYRTKILGADTWDRAGRRGPRWPRCRGRASTTWAMRDRLRGSSTPTRQGDRSCGPRRRRARHRRRPRHRLRRPRRR